MKKLIALLLALCLLCILPACGVDNQDAQEEVGVSESMATTSRGTPINGDFDETVHMKSTPESTCFSEIGYNNGTLVVTFRDSGASYAYYDAPSNVWDALCGADSMGGYYNSSIKGQYYCEKLD